MVGFHHGGVKPTRPTLSAIVLGALFSPWSYGQGKDAEPGQMRRIALAVSGF